jgi:hypothetical protein
MILVMVCSRVWTLFLLHLTRGFPCLADRRVRRGIDVMPGILRVRALTGSIASTLRFT